jgi:quinol monooxygenase YgiN
VVCLAVTYVVKPGSEEAAAEHFRALVEGSRAEPGCRTYTVHRAIDDPRTFFIYELYDDMAALETHRTSPHFLEHGRGGVQPLAERRVALTCTPID